jgi:hypothetical protein
MHSMIILMYSSLFDFWALRMAAVTSELPGSMTFVWLQCHAG